MLAADAVLVVAPEYDGRGMFVELGAALARCRDGDLEHLVVIGPIKHQSVVYHHPSVSRVATVNELLDGLT